MKSGELGMLASQPSSPKAPFLIMHSSLLTPYPLPTRHLADKAEQRQLSENSFIARRKIYLRIFTLWGYTSDMMEEGISRASSPPVLADNYDIYIASGSSDT